MTSSLSQRIDRPGGLDNHQTPACLESLWPGGGRLLKLFFDGVCGPRSETLTHIQGLFSLKKWLIRQFFQNFCKSQPISKGFSASKMADSSIFFAIVVKWDPCLRIFWPKWYPCLRIFDDKVTHLGGTSPYVLTCEYPPGVSGEIL